MWAASVSKWRRKRRPGVGQTEAVGAERDERLRHPARDLVGHELDEVGDGNDRPLPAPARAARTASAADRRGGDGSGVRRTTRRRVVPCSWSRSRLRRRRRDDRRAVCCASSAASIAVPLARIRRVVRAFAGCISISIQPGEDAVLRRRPASRVAGRPRCRGSGSR